MVSGLHLSSLILPSSFTSSHLHFPHAFHGEVGEMDVQVRRFGSPAEDGGGGVHGRNDVIYRHGRSFRRHCGGVAAIDGKGGARCQALDAHILVGTEVGRAG